MVNHRGITTTPVINLLLYDPFDVGKGRSLIGQPSLDLDILSFYLSNQRLHGLYDAIRAIGHGDFMQRSVVSVSQRLTILYRHLASEWRTVCLIGYEHDGSGLV